MNSTSCRWWAAVLAGALLGLPLAGAEPQEKPAVPQTVADLIPPPLAAEENAAPLYLLAVETLESETVWDTDLAELAAHAGQTGRYNLLEPAGNIHIPEEGNRQALVHDAIAEFDRRLDTPAVEEVMSLLERAATKSRCRFDIDYSKGAAILLPHLAGLRTLGRFLSAAALALAERHDAESAIHCLQLDLILADHLRDEPLLISQLVRAALLAIATDNLREVGNQTALPAKSSEILDPWLARADDRTPWVLALHGERILLGEWLFVGTPEEVGQRLKEVGNPTSTAPPTAEQLAAELAIYRRLMLRMAALMAQPYPEVEAELAAIRAEADKSSPTGLVRAFVPNLDACFRKASELQATIRQARLALRLSQYQTEHAAYPATLADLGLDAALAQQLTDPFTGQAFHYHAQSKGYLLYSVGPDLADNDGRRRQGNAKEGYDLVWETER